jgi:2-(3-amino-3-carboxypropyl)histidine synthase
VTDLYNLELPRVVEEVKRRGSRRVLLQLPDGMRPFAFQLVKAIREGAGAEVLLSGDSCYGACDIANRQASELGADLLVHYGHSPMVEGGDVPVLYIYAEVDIDVKRLVEDCLPYLGPWKRIGVVTTIQHVHKLAEVASEMAKWGLHAVMGEGDAKTPFRGQVLGCHYGTATSVAGDVDAFLYIGGGQFHPVGLVLSTGKPVVVANPYDGSVAVRHLDEFMGLAKKRYAGIAVARGADKLGILVSSKPGQVALDVARELERRFRERGVEAAVIYMDEVRAEHLNNYVEPQAFIVTACPRVAMDGLAGVDRPMLTVREAYVVLGDLRWEDVWGRGIVG